MEASSASARAGMALTSVRVRAEARASRMMTEGKSFFLAMKLNSFKKDLS
jgi:hypothetical protein